MTEDGTEGGAESLERLSGRAQATAEDIERAFAEAGESLARSLARAAADGEVSLAELARSVLAAVNAAAGSGSGSLGEAIEAAARGVFGGTRSEGGPVVAGGAYLVGERGPEVFRPAGAGSVEPWAGGVTVNVQVSGEGAGALHRSETQIAQALARAVSLGARRL